ncbi:MAG: sigma-70 family RNA polymerase sigma factor [Chthonomonadales bacterium]|nr:sigma-70 family RNA polymerase sigma factor [Chthonomonadales bacterium]
MTAAEYRTTYFAAYRAARKQFLTREDAEDAAQNAVLRMYHCGDELSAPLANYMGYLAGIDEYRRRERTLRTMRAACWANSPHVSDGCQTQAIDWLEFDAMQTILRQALNDLQYRAIRLLSFGHTQVEVARALGCTDRTVRNARYAARQVLREAGYNDDGT